MCVHLLNDNKCHYADKPFVYLDPENNYIILFNSGPLAASTA